MYTRRRKTRLGCCFFQFLIVIILIAALFSLFLYYVRQPTNIISPLSEEQTPSVSLLELVIRQKDPDTLKNLVKREIGSSWANYSVYVADYNSKFTMGINESVIFDAASVNKVPILAALYEEVQKGAIDFNRVITLQAKDVQDYGTGSIRYDPIGSTYSVKTLARLMIQKSDNTAAYILANHIVGISTIQNYVNGWGMTQTDIKENTTSNRDMAILFEKIFNKKLVSPALSEEMLALLRDSDFEDRLPGQLPESATVYHKIGTIIGGVHDAGVVTDGNMKYYIGVFTADIRDEEQAAALLSDVSRVVYEFLK
jgi:beta-lactamase class A